MDDTLKTGIVARLQQCGETIRANMQARKINASGRTSASIRVRETATGVQLVGGNSGTHNVEAPFGLQQRNTAPLPTVEVGRAGGEVPKGFYYIIKQWSREKGLRFRSEQERGTFAYFTARKIAREGTKRNKANEDIYSTAVTEAAADIRAQFTANVRNTIRMAIGGITTTGTHF